jgi:hypothetical protein
MHYFRLIIFLLLITSVTNAYADSCQTLLCMAGKLQGQAGGSDCDASINDYFRILVYGRHDKFDASGTAAARLNYLNSCPADGVGDWPTQINAAYGTVH